jgi:hypothetical protein
MQHRHGRAGAAHHGIQCHAVGAHAPALEAWKEPHFASPSGRAAGLADTGAVAIDSVGEGGFQASFQARFEFEWV